MDAVLLSEDVQNRINSYRDLRVWKEALDIAEYAYRVTASFPREEMYGLTSQIRIAAASVPANIAEGYGRDNLGNYIQFLRIAQGSLKEIETHMFLAARLGMINKDVRDNALSSCVTVGKMIRALFRSLQKASSNPLSSPLPTTQSRLPQKAKP